MNKSLSHPVLKLAMSNYFDVVDRGVTKADFEFNQDQELFAAIGNIYDRRGDCDLDSIFDELVRMGSSITWEEVLSAASREAKPEMLKDHCKALRRESQKRKLAALTFDLQNVATNDSMTIEQVSEATDAALTAFSADAVEQVQSMTAFMGEAAKAIVARTERKGIQGIPTGFSKLDEMLGGLNKGNLIILAARPAMGKTAIALNIAVNAQKEGKNVMLLSLEMTKNEVFDRYVSITGRIRHSKLRTGDLGEDELDCLNRVCAEVSKQDNPLMVDDSGSPTIMDLKAKVRGAHRRKKIDLVIIDYLGLIRDPTTKSRIDEVSNVSAGLKALAKELDIPVLCLAQLNRGVESRDDKRPMTSDLRDSGSIEQDADSVSFLYRDVVYNEDTPYKDLAEVLVRKNRHGQTGVAHLQSDLATQRFRDYPTQVRTEYLVPRNGGPRDKKAKSAYNP